MPTRPDPITLTNVSADVINAIRNSGSINYRDYIPVATADAESIRDIGNIIMDAPNLRNAFATDLINMVIKVIITSSRTRARWPASRRGRATSTRSTPRPRSRRSPRRPSPSRRRALVSRSWAIS